MFNLVGTFCNENVGANPDEKQVEYWAFCISDGLEDRPLAVKNVLLKYGWEEDHILTKHIPYDQIDASLSPQDFFDGISWLGERDDLNDVSLIFFASHGSPSGLHLNGLIPWDNISVAVDELDSKGIAIIISACYSGSGIPYLKKDGRVIITSSPGDVMSIGGLWRQYHQALAGLGDYINDQNGIVSAEEVFLYLNTTLLYNHTEFSREYETEAQNNYSPQIQDDYPGELNLVFLSSDDAEFDQIQSLYFTSFVAVNNIGYKHCAAQSFVPVINHLTKLKLIVWRGVDEDDPITISIRKNLSAEDLTSITIPTNQIQPLVNQLTEFDFDDIQVTPGEKYYIVCTTDGDGDYTLNTEKSDNLYPQGELYVSSDGGATWTVSKETSIQPGHPSYDLTFITYGWHNELPIAKFVYDSPNITLTETIQFNDTSIDSDGNITAWIWDFGDGNTSNKQNPNYFYQKTGTYTVTLTITDNEGGVNQTTKTIVVSESSKGEQPDVSQSEDNTPGFELILVVMAIILALFWNRKRIK